MNETMFYVFYIIMAFVSGVFVFKCLLGITTLFLFSDERIESEGIPLDLKNIFITSLMGSTIVWATTGYIFLNLASGLV